ncbi:MAG: beta-ketoacyl-ACP synthase II [Francisellaceae bacterium]|nr:beta-ketoacyl-ACP synthase II [Francisellaceae bacterium]MBT6207537.1 beta-ketoacyl-ACP synthase II [Francisellaceae bacterium]MBT6538169.1 beta-ketoacyl-ACP synthase II [Francisellaceae bacterium]
MSALKKRVVVTGLGVISALGCGVANVWENAAAGKSGIRTIDDFDASKLPTQFAGSVSNFDAADYMPGKDVKKCDLFMQYGIASSVQAIEDSGIASLPDTLKNEIGVIIGSGIGGVQAIEQNKLVLEKSGSRKISPFFIPSCIINLIAGHVSIMYGLKGPNLALATACTTGTHAIGLAARLIAYGDAKIMVAGGAEKGATPLSIAGFAAARALSRNNDNPAGASRPWDKDRDGFVIGDGGATLVIEEYEHAVNRGAKIYAELSGFGMSGDAYHITKPSIGGDGAIRSMRAAMRDAGIENEPSKIDYINAHATSTPTGDIDESRAIETLLGEHAKKVLVSSTKSMTGHLLGAAGAIEALFTVLSIQKNIALPTINLDMPSEGCNLDYVANKAREINISCAMSNSFGFGGTNGSLIFNEVS